MVSVSFLPSSSPEICSVAWLMRWTVSSRENLMISQSCPGDVVLVFLLDRQQQGKPVFLDVEAVGAYPHQQVGQVDALTEERQALVGLQAKGQGGVFDFVAPFGRLKAKLLRKEVSKQAVDRIIHDEGRNSGLDNFQKST